MASKTNGTSTAAAAAMRDPVPLWMAGVEVTTANTFDVFSPTTGEKLWASSSISPEEAVLAIEAAQGAFKTWKKTKPADVRRIIMKAADIFESRAEELKKVMQQETGSLLEFTDGLINMTIEMMRDTAGRAASILGSISQTATSGQSALIFKEPYGVNFAIAPWNAPYVLGTRAFLYAIAGGNTVILKGSELCPRTFWMLGSIWKDAGLPDGVLSVIYHRPSDAVAVTNTIIEHPLVRKVNFTGSTMTGSIIASKAGKELKPVLMELGGKASAIICEDADIDKAAMQVALGAFLHAGQICMSTERVLVHRKILPEFSKALKAMIEIVYPNSKDAPVVATPSTIGKIEKLLGDAVSKGAQVLHGDVSHKEQSEYRMRPVIVSNVKKEMDIFYTESFGPTVSLIAVDSDDAAVEIANDTEYGLSGAIFTEDLARGLRMAKEIDSGAVHINSMTFHDEALLPHGGVKKSGWGRFNAQWGIEEFLKLKTVTYME